jgi:hypothetical protein
MGVVMTERHYPDWIKAFLDYASFSEAPLKFLFWTGVSTVAGALRRRCWLDMKMFQWVPNFYIVLVAPPGIVSKSTTINVGMNLLRQLDFIRFGPDVATWQALVTEFAKAQELVLFPETGEYLPMSCLTIPVDEFGTFLNPKDQEMVNVLIALWDGKRGRFSKITKLSGSDSIENPWINLIACTTPEWIAGNFPEYMIGGGFTSRCIFVYANNKRQYVAYPDEQAPPEFYEQQQKLVHDLELISQLVGEFKIDPLARQYGREWYERHWQTKPPELDNEQFGGYLARKQTHIHKLAMVLSAAQRDDLLITREILEASENFVTAIEDDMPQIYGRMGQNELTKGAQQIVDIVKARGEIDRKDLYSLLFRTLAYRDFELALMSALSAGKVMQFQRGDAIYLRIKQ